MFLAGLVIGIIIGYIITSLAISLRLRRTNSDRKKNSGNNHER